MEPSAIVIMVLICGLVWGGFGVILWTAVRKEGRKRQRPEELRP
jgi:hypothetical protein